MANGKTTEEILAEALGTPENTVTGTATDPAIDPQTIVVAPEEADKEVKVVTETPPADLPVQAPTSPPAPPADDGEEKPRKKYGKYIS